MRVLYLSPSGQLGGAERSLLDFLASIRAAQPDWPLSLVVAEEGPLVSQSRALGVPTTVVRFPLALGCLGDAGADGPAGHQRNRLSLLTGLLTAAPAIGAYIWKLRRIIREFTPDVIHTNGFKMHVLGLWARPHRVPIIWHIHDYVSARPIMARLMRRYSMQCSLAVANSESVATDVKAVCGNRLTVKTIYNGIDLESFSPTGPTLDLDALSGLPPAPPETIRVGMLATLARWKGHETFLRALSLLAPDLPLRGFVVGGALYQTNGSQYSLEELKAMARSLGLLDRVGFTGFVDEPAAAMRALDIVVHASTQPEPFGLVIAEAMGCGRPVIISEAGGATELITEGGDALAHSPGDASVLASCIRQLATDCSLRGRLGRAGRNTAEHRFDRGQLAAALIPIYQEVVSSAN